MPYTLYQLVIPLFLSVVPWLITRYVFTTSVSKQMGYKRAAPYLLTASLLWAIDFALPDFPLFGGATDTFVMHTGGGVVAAILFWYAVSAYTLKCTLWWQEPLFLYLFVSGLGVMNELLEFFLHQTGYLPDSGGDTWWDLTANTLGAGLAFLIVRLARSVRTSG